MKRDNLRNYIAPAVEQLKTQAENKDAILQILLIFQPANFTEFLDSISLCYLYKFNAIKFPDEITWKNFWKIINGIDHTDPSINKLFHFEKVDKREICLLRVFKELAENIVIRDFTYNRVFRNIESQNGFITLSRYLERVDFFNGYLLSKKTFLKYEYATTKIPERLHAIGELIYRLIELPELYADEDPEAFYYKIEFVLSAIKEISEEISNRNIYSIKELYKLLLSEINNHHSALYSKYKFYERKNILRLLSQVDCSLICYPDDHDNISDVNSSLSKTRINRKSSSVENTEIDFPNYFIKDLCEEDSVIREEQNNNEDREEEYGFMPYEPIQETGQGTTTLNNGFFVDIDRIISNIRHSNPITTAHEEKTRRRPIRRNFKTSGQHGTIGDSIFIDYLNYLYEHDEKAFSYNCLCGNTGIDHIRLESLTALKPSTHISDNTIYYDNHSLIYKVMNGSPDLSTVSDNENHVTDIFQLILPKPINDILLENIPISFEGLSAVSERLARKFYKQHGGISPTPARLNKLLRSRISHYGLDDFYISIISGDCSGTDKSLSNYLKEDIDNINKCWQSTLERFYGSKG